jgi:hypothetical protein
MAALGKKAMTYEYDIIISTGAKPDLTAVNNLAEEGWELMQVIQSTSEQMTGQWGYVMRRKVTPSTEPVPEQQPA